MIERDRIEQPPADPVEPGFQEAVGHSAPSSDPGDPPAVSPRDPLEPEWREAGYRSSIDVWQAEGR